MHGHQVNPTGPADALFFVFQRHEEERSQRHEFPTHEEQHAVARHDNQQHAGGQQIEEEPRNAEILRGRRASGDTRSRRRPPTSSPGQSPAAKTAESGSISMLAEPSGNGHASRRDCDWPETSTQSDWSKTMPPPSSALAAPIRHAPFGLLPAANESRPPANKIANAIKNQTMTKRLSMRVRCRRGNALIDGLAGGKDLLRASPAWRSPRQRPAAASAKPSRARR